MSNPYKNYSDNDVFNEYWRVIDDIEELENREFYDWQTWQYEECQRQITGLCIDMDDLEKEARRRDINLSWTQPKSDKR